jgi:putative transposase
MLEGVADLTLGQLNEATLAWLEMEYNRKVHSQLGQTPLQCYLAGRDVGRPAGSSEALHLAFTAERVRSQRRSDGTCTLHGVRLEVPSRYGHFPRLHLRFAAWDLGYVHLADPTTGAILCRLYPLDKARNAQGHRAPRQGILGPPEATATPPAGIAPLLQKILQQYATTGLPPAYLPKDEIARDSKAS